MPINRDEWNKGRTRDTPEETVYLFLKKNSDKAFSVSEIVSALENQPATTSVWSFLAGIARFLLVQTALETLTNEGRVKARTVKEKVGEETYYVAA